MKTSDSNLIVHRNYLQYYKCLRVPECARSYFRLLSDNKYCNEWKDQIIHKRILTLSKLLSTQNRMSVLHPLLLFFVSPKHDGLLKADHSRPRETQA